MIRSNGFSRAEREAAARDALSGLPGRCEVCYGVGLAGERAPGRSPGDAAVMADTTGHFVIEDDQGAKWFIQQGESLADHVAFFDSERQRALADVHARFDGIRAVLERRAMLPDQQFVPIKPDRLLGLVLDLEDQEAKNEQALTEQQAAQLRRERETKSRRDKAVQLLRTMFAKEPEVSAKEATAQAEAAGITRDAIFRARRELSVEVWKNGRAGWFWRLPSTVQNIRSSDCLPHPGASDHGCEAPVKEAVASLRAEMPLSPPTTT